MSDAHAAQPTQSPEAPYPKRDIFGFGSMAAPVNSIATGSTSAAASTTSASLTPNARPILAPAAQNLNSCGLASHFEKLQHSRAAGVHGGENQTTTSSQVPPSMPPTPSSEAVEPKRLIYCFGSMTASVNSIATGSASAAAHATAASPTPSARLVLTPVAPRLTSDGLASFSKKLQRYRAAGTHKGEVQSTTSTQTPSSMPVSVRGESTTAQQPMRSPSVTPSFSSTVTTSAPSPANGAPRGPHAAFASSVIASPHVKGVPQHVAPHVNGAPQHVAPHVNGTSQHAAPHVNGTYTASTASSVNTGLCCCPCNLCIAYSQCSSGHGLCLSESQFYGTASLLQRCLAASIHGGEHESTNSDDHALVLRSGLNLSRLTHMCEI
ncbi:hypothetical protein KCU81_g4301, partial [Aureobasidium melanogenum]|uniref:Uncharacterized protein n=1 Tax=Aureobasidium melanogenum (strain CBS 110374) TaxID=1043003 RepID=A0A074VPK7_AURM1